MDASIPIGPSAPLRALQIGMWWGTDRSGGLDRVYADLVENLPAAGVEVSGLVQGPEDVEALTGGRVRAFAARGGLIGRGYHLRALAARQMREFDPDMVAVHFAFYAALAGRALRSRPLVVHFHGPWSGEAAQEGAGRHIVAAKRSIERAVYRRADRIIVLSHAFGRLLSRQCGVAEDVIRVVPGPIDIARFAVPQSRAEARAILGWPGDRPILITVRRLTNRVGLDRLIAAMTRVVPVEPDVLLLVAGTGPLADRLKSQVEDAGLARNIGFLGFVPDERLPLAFRAADINVVPTVALEGFGLVAAEALAAGTPSMVTPVGGLPEVVSPLSADLLFRSPAPDDLADGLIAALRGTVRLPDSAACRAYAAGRFASHLAARRTAAVYREPLA